MTPATHPHHSLALQVEVAVKKTEKKKSVPKPLVSGPQPVPWVHERWLAGQWEIKLETGRWARFPPAAEKVLENALAEQLSEAILSLGDFGEQRYRVDLVNGVATNESASPPVQRLIRRVAETSS